MNKVVWKALPGFDGNYLVSNTGKMYSVKKGRLIAENAGPLGYRVATLRKNGKKIYKKVHRAVLETFTGEMDLICNHKNGNKADNRLENLEYCTNRENIRHSFKVLGRKAVRGEDTYNSTISNKERIEIVRLFRRGWGRKIIAEWMGCKYHAVGNTLRTWQ